MNILVLLKQVPNVIEISIDPQTLAIDRSRAAKIGRASCRERV